MADSKNYGMIRQGDADVYGYVELMVDTAEDITSLPTTFGPGSNCLVIEDSSVWMLGTDKKWHEI